MSEEQNTKEDWNEKKDGVSLLSNKKKKVSRTKILQTVSKKYTSSSGSTSSTSRNGTNKRTRHLGGISRGYLDSGTISNTMRLYNKSNGSDSNSLLQYSIKRNRSKKLGNYQRKALSKLTGLSNKKKLRDLAMMFSDDDGDVEDEGINDNFEDFFRDNSRAPDDDVEMMNDEEDHNGVSSGKEGSSEIFSDQLTGTNKLFVSGESSNNYSQEQSQLPSLASLRSSQGRLIDSHGVTQQKAEMTSLNGLNSSAIDKFDINKDKINAESMHRKVSTQKGIMSNDGEEDYDDDEFDYDGDEDFDGDNSTGNRKKELRRRKQLESDFDDQFLMPPGSHSIDNLITEFNGKYGNYTGESKKSSESPDLNIGLVVGKRRRRSSNYQDIANKSGILASFASAISSQPDTKKIKLSSTTPDGSDRDVEYSAQDNAHLDGTVSPILTKKLKRKHLKPPKVVLDPTYSKPLTIKDIRDLVIYSLDKNEKNRPVWCKVENRMNIEKVVVLQIPGVQPKDLKYKGTALDSFEELLNDKNKILKTTETFFDYENTLTLSSKAPGNSSFVFSAYSAFTNVPLSKQKQASVIKNLSKKKAQLSDMLLTLDEMIELKYPIHPNIAGDDGSLFKKICDLNMEMDNAGEWVESYAKNVSGDYVSVAYALDCEMCLTAAGHELTRISIVNFDGAIVYDKLVRPENEITDYLTRFSGITEAMMENVDYRLEQVQQDLLQIFDSRDVLIGHSLQSDFKVLKFRHPNIVDTAVIYEHVKGPPFKPALKKLASVFLGKEIQNDDISGHDPSVDARTCVELVNLKLQKGLQIGLNLNSETIFKKLQDSSNVRSLIFNKFGPDESFVRLNQHSNLRSLSFKDDSDIIDKILKNLDDCSLFVGKLNSLENARYFTNKSGASNPSFGTSEFDIQTVDSVKEEQAIKTLAKVLKQLTDNVSKNTMVVLFSGSGDLRLYKKITSEINSIHLPEKRRLESLRRKEELRQAVEQARDSIVTIYIKK